MRRSHVVRSQIFFASRFHNLLIDHTTLSDKPSKNTLVFFSYEGRPESQKKPKSLLLFNEKV